MQKGRACGGDEKKGNHLSIKKRTQGGKGGVKKAPGIEVRTLKGMRIRKKHRMKSGGGKPQSLGHGKFISSVIDEKRQYWEKWLGVEYSNGMYAGPGTLKNQS